MVLPTNAPAFGAVLGSASFAAGPVSMDVTSYVNAELAADRVVSFAIRSDGPSSDVSLRSKEYTDGTEWPRLELE